MHAPSDAQAPGPNADTSVTPPSDTVVTAPTVQQPCTGMTRSGRPCTRPVGTILTPDGWRCPHHRPKAAPDPEARATRPPVTSLRTPRDAVRLSSWAAIQLALGKLDYKQASGVTSACREFRASWTLAERADARVQATDAYVEAAERWHAADDAHDREAGRQAFADMGAAIARLTSARERGPGRPPKVPPRPPIYGGLVTEAKP